jgi:hypothetical protein
MKDIQAVKKILSELSFIDGASRRLVAATTRTATGILVMAPIRRTMSFFQGSQNLCLNLRRHLGDLVEEKGPAVSLLEAIQVPL